MFEVGGGEVHVFPGNYEDYLFRKSGAAAAAPPEPAPKQASSNQHAPKSDPAKPDPAKDAAADKNRRLNPIKLRQMKERQRAIEDEITRLEVEITDFEQALSHFQSAQQSIDIAELLESRRTDMKNLMAEWEEVSEIIEANR